MYKAITFFLISFLIFSCNPLISQIRAISNEQTNQIWQRSVVKNNKIRVQYIAMLPPSVDMNDSNSFSLGKLVKVTNYDPDGKILSLSEYESTEDSLNTRFEYFNDGYLKTQIKTAAGANSLVTSFNYDSLGKYTSISSSGSEYREYEIIYDKKGNLLKKHAYSYYPKTDKLGNVIEAEQDRILADIYEFKYDKQNNLIEEKVKSNGRLLSTTKYKYGKSKQKLNELIVFLGNKVKINYLYDENLKLTGYIKTNIDGSKSIYKAEYEYYR